MEVLDRLVAFDTVSRNPCRAAVDWIADLLRARASPSRYFRRTDAGKASLLARVGPAREGGIVLSGHIDVVPVDGQSWASDPFRLTLRNGRLYGRGTADMKAFVALAVAALHDCAGFPCLGLSTWRCPMTRRSAASACGPWWTA